MKNSWSMTVGRATLLALMIAGAASACRASDDQGASTTACDRACLNGLVDQYLDAVVAHEPSRLPATTFVKFTEDGQHLTLGDGLWRTATGKGTYKFYIDDPDAGQVGFVGTMREAGQPVILALRLKIENQKISEIETILGRGQMAQGGAANLEKMGSPRPAFSEDIPSAERVRLDLIKTANKYFSAMEQNDGRFGASGPEVAEADAVRFADTIDPDRHRMFASSLG